MGPASSRSARSTSRHWLRLALRAAGEVTTLRFTTYLSLKGELKQMKITAISCHPVQVGIRPHLLVKVDTDEGLHGWGESGLLSREAAVTGRRRALRRLPGGARPDADRRALAGDVSKPVLRRRAGLHGGDLSHRHRSPRHQGQGARCSRARAAGWSASESIRDSRRSTTSRSKGPGRGGLVVHPAHAAVRASTIRTSSNRASPSR